MRVRLRFTLIFTAEISHHSTGTENNVAIFKQTETKMYSVNDPLVCTVEN